MSLLTTALENKAAQARQNYYFGKLILIYKKK